MCAKIIDSRRYKTITKSQLEKKKRNNEKKLKAEKSNYKKNNKYTTTNNNGSLISNLRIKKHREKKIEEEILLYSRPQRTKIKEPKQRIYVPKSFIIVCAVFACIFLMYISFKITKIDERITEAVFNNKDNETQVQNVALEPNYDLKIALTSLDTTDTYKTTNLILSDLYKNISLSLIKIKNNYDITYQIAKKIEKKNDTEYIVTINDSYKIDIDDIRYSIEKIMSYGEESIYYNKVSNIYSVEKNENNNEITIRIVNPDPYFIFNLDFPIIEENEETQNSGYTMVADEKSVLFQRNQKYGLDNLNSINVKNYTNLKEIIEEFGKDNVDVFFATSNNDMQLIGKRDYNVKKYRDGETLFIFGNKNSNIFSKKEVRTALMYSLNREEIVKNSDNNFIEIIDLPFIYSSIKYKYDIVGANNIMTSNGWRKNSSGIFDKSENGNYINATLRLLVNSEDQSKVNVANNIKSMAYNAGINVDIIAVSAAEVEEKVNIGDYDIVLASVYLNEAPNVEFIRQYLEINSNVSQAFTQVEQSSCEDMSKNIQNLQYVLSDEVACIGIYARNINLVYQKYVYFGDINYMSIFSSLDTIGKKLN